MRHLATFGFSSLIAALFALGCGGDGDAPPRPSMDGGLIILGVDGMDPRLLEKYVSEGKMPNLARLVEKQDHYRVLGTSNPPQSPVAWSTFLTGQHHQGHGIYDFVHRDPVQLEPYLSTSRTRAPDWVVTVGSMAFPLSSGGIDLLRQGDAFWQVLEEDRVPATVVKVPANFPPAESTISESMAGMGTPDLLGTYGTFQLLTDDPRFIRDDPDQPGSKVGKSLSGGFVHALDFAGTDGAGPGHAATASLNGPPNPLSADAERVIQGDKTVADGIRDGDIMSVEVEVVRDPERDVALLTLDDQQILLTPGEWTEWVPVSFTGGLLSIGAPGMVRLYLASVRPHVRIYVSPTNIDPMDPAMPISSPPSYAENLAHDIGRYYTQGMPEDTKALAADALDDDEFLAQAELVFEERLALLERELERYQGGVLFFYFSSIDQLCHVFWRTIEPDASPEDAAYAHVIPDLYQRMDKVIGGVLDRYRDQPGVEVVIMSDHGFSPYRYKVHLNTWLAEQGYLSLLPPDEVGRGALGHIDWDNTQAYGLGLNQLFINLKGREARGVVPREDYENLVQSLQRDLEAMRDPETGARVVTEAVAPGDAGAFADRAPDLLVGYNRGYRSSDSSALGQVGDEIVSRNRDKWSGDHCMHPSHVPGVLLSTRPLSGDIDDPSLHDLAPTILETFGVDVPAAMTGRPLWTGAPH